MLSRRVKIISAVLASLSLILSLIVLVNPLIDFSVANESWNGYSEVSELLNASYIESSLDELSIYSPGSSIVILISYREYSASELYVISKFISDGGIALILDDFGYGNQVLEFLEAPVRINKSGMLIDPLFKYRSGKLPRVSDFYGELSILNLSSIVLNYATKIDIEGDGVSVLAESSSFSYFDMNFNGRYDDGEPIGPFPVMVKFRYGKGVVYVLSDPSAFINSMLVIGDNKRLIMGLVGERQVIIDQSHLNVNLHYVIRMEILDVVESVRNIYLYPYLIIVFTLVVAYYFERFSKGVG